MKRTNTFPPKEPGEPVANPHGEWQGMPEFEHVDQTSFRKVIVHFKDQDAVDLFERLIGQSLGKKLKSIWFPAAEIGRCAGKAYQANA